MGIDHSHASEQLCIVNGECSQLASHTRPHLTARTLTFVNTSASASWCSGRSSAASRPAHTATASGRGARANVSATPCVTRLAATAGWICVVCLQRLHCVFVNTGMTGLHAALCTGTARMGQLAGGQLTVCEAGGDERVGDSGLDALLTLELGHDLGCGCHEVGHRSAFQTSMQTRMQTSMRKTQQLEFVKLARPHANTNTNTSTHPCTAPPCCKASPAPGARTQSGPGGGTSGRHGT